MYLPRLAFCFCTVFNTVGTPHLHLGVNFGWKLSRYHRYVIFIRLLPATGCGSMEVAVVILCFHSSYISACITNRDFSSRRMVLWPGPSSAPPLSSPSF